MKEAARFVIMFVFQTLISNCDSGTRPKLMEQWNPRNDPLNLRGDYDRRLAAIPLTGAVENVAWSDSYWPSRNGGIANRWRQLSSDAFTYQLHSKEEVHQLSQRELSYLSPAEKYDIYKGDFTFPLVKRERRRTNPSALGWEGICHGWEPASINFPEPKAVLLEGPSRIKVPFAASDIKALLSYLAISLILQQCLCCAMKLYLICFGCRSMRRLF